MSKPLRSCILAALFVLAPRGASALTQPDGTVVPVPKPNPQQDLQSIFDLQGETIKVQPDAADVPETFDPKCNLTFTLISRGTAGFQSGFGWYNATGSVPPLSDLHVLIPCTAQPVSAFPLNIKGDPAYKGGKIGFFLITPEGKSSSCASSANFGYVYYSEKTLNPDNAGPSSYIHLLVYDSKVKASSFYFAWEDLFAGGDNEFSDLVARVDGISCSGGGAPCNTGKLGICAAGTLQCQNGALGCVEQSKPQQQKCNGLDNNCDGIVDLGPCPPGAVCYQGNCVPTCGKDNCSPTTTCDPASGLCVDPSCVGVSCPGGTSCTKGKCVAPCDGAVCPHGTSCVAGACIDLCVGLTCDAEQVCVGGTCLETCACTGCSGGEVCAASGVCVDPGCNAKSCPGGQYCSAGQCVDSCAGVICPGGGVCNAGVCAPPSGTGGSGGAAGAGAGGKAGVAGSGGQSGAGQSGAGQGGAGQGGAGGKGVAGQGGVAGKGGQGGVAGAAGASGKAGAGATGGGAGSGIAGGGAGGASAGGKTGAAGAPAKGGTAGTGGANAGGKGGVGSGGKSGSQSPSAGPGDVAQPGGCGCALPGDGKGARWGVLLASVALLSLRRRRREG